MRCHLTLFTLLLATATTRAGDAPQYLDPDKQTGSAKAVVVGAVPLVHTTQLLPVDGMGNVVGKGEPTRQVERVLDDLAALLKETNAALAQAVKLNFCVASPEVAAEVHKALARRFPARARPAVSFVAGTLPHPDAVVAVDAVALAAGDSPAAVKLHGAGTAGARAATLPVGARVYISGQAERGANLAEATRKTMESLHATLKFLDLKDEQVVQVKCFLTPMSGVADVRRAIAAYFGKRPVPPVVLVEWKSALPIEIELIAAAGKERAGAPVEYLTPPGVKASPVFSRVARINRGKLVYVSGLYGTSKQDPAAEIAEIFTALGRVLGQAGSDLRHLAKATYYVTSADAVRTMGQLRPKYYDPRRPPTASLAVVPGVGRADRTVTLDMIAVVPPDRPLNK
ncbi:MAG: RidA family protein [Gemmataceae bacterium]|nr:RidA family protein [Gemmataceae bacterium]